MKYVFNTKQKAVDYITPFNFNNPQWTARLNIGKIAGHTSIDLYSNSGYVGTLQSDILGSALYKGKNDNGLQGSDIVLTWQKVLAGVEEVYLHETTWETEFGHDITAAVFRQWGMNGQGVYRATYPHLPGDKIGLVSAKIAGLLETSAKLGDNEDLISFPDAWKTSPTPTNWNIRI